MTYLDMMQTDPPTPPSLPETSWLSIAGSLADTAFELDEAGNFAVFGPGEPFGYPAVRLLGTSAALLFSLPAEGTLASVIATIRGKRTPWHGFVWLRPADGDPRFCRLSLAPRCNAEPQAAGIYGLVFELPPASGQPVPSLPSRASEMLDEETGIWSAKTFAQEASRRFDRLDVEELPGTMIMLGFSRAAPHLRPAIAMKLAEELRETVRPTDLLGRIDAVTIALWCDGMDQLTGAERATRFCNRLPAVLPDQAVITAGVVPRWPGSHDEAELLIERASIALQLADLATERAPADEEVVGAWRVWQND